MVLENKTLEDKARELLSERGVSLQDIGELVFIFTKRLYRRYYIRYVH